MSEHDELSFPRHAARTRRFTFGAPRSFTVTEDGRTVHFLRSRGGTDPMTCLWALDVGTGDETLLADPVALLAGGHEDLPAEERALRERRREAAGGVVAYSADRAGSTLAFGLDGAVYAVRDGGTPVRVDTAVPAVGPRVDPTGQRVGYVHGGAFHVAELTGGRQVLAEPEGTGVGYGLAEFIAAEEMSRTRGFWWAPDGARALVARVDEAPVQRWYIADPAHPERAPVEHAYPAAGTANADVRLFVLGLDGGRVEVRWDRAGFEYLTRVAWSTHGALVAVQSRDQRTVRLLRVDPDTGATDVVREDTDPTWVELVSGVPTWCGDKLVWVADVDGWRRLVVDGVPVTPDGTQVRQVLTADAEGVLVSASTEPTEVQVLDWRPDGTLAAVSSGPGVHTAVRAGGTTVVTSSTLDSDRAQSTVTSGGADSWLVRSFTDTPAVRPAVRLLRAGDRELRTAVLFPTGHRQGSARLPVLLDPYGGPHAQRVLASRRAFYESQWFADQGFAVVVADGRGTPGRGAAWERAVHGDLATPVLDDQVAALEAAAATYPDLDLHRVGIRGWSFGGYLAALAVLRKPDLFHVGIAGAPVTDLTLYDTHYQERYLGDPHTNPEAYRRSSIIDDAPNLRRPLLIIHGLVDDNVVVAHTLRLSGALLAAGRPHTVLPLTGITHMATQETVAENLLNLQVAFLRDAIG